MVNDSASHIVDEEILTQVNSLIKTNEIPKVIYRNP